MKKLFISFLTASMLVSSTVVSPSVFNMNGYSVSAAESITIISQPSDFYAVNKAPVSIPVTAAGDDLSYQWWVALPGSDRFYISSEKDNVYNTIMDSKRDGRRVYCVITDKHGKSVRTETATLHMETLSFTKQPSDFHAVNKTPVSIPVKADGDDLSYQWWVALPGSDRFYISSEKDDTYNTLMDSKRDGRRVYCVVTDKYGNSTRSETATLHMETLSFTKQPSDLCGKNKTFVSTTVETNYEVVSYQWYVALAGSNKFYKSSITKPKYETLMTSERNGRRVYCVVKDKYGNTAQSETVTLRMEGEKCTSHRYGEEEAVCKDSKGYKFEKSCLYCDKTEYVYYDAVITFVDDDAKVDALNHWERIMDETGIKMTSAVIAGKVKDTTKYNGYAAYAGWDMINHMKEKGMDFVHHTYNHKNLTTLTEAQLHDDFKKCKEVLSANGIESDLLVYPNNAFNDTVLSVVPQYFSGAVTCKGKLNTKPLDNDYTIYRVNLNDNSNVKNIIFGSTWVEDKETSKTTTVACQGIRTVDNMKQYANNAVKNKAWLVFMSHAYYSPSGKYYFDEYCEDTIIEFCNDVNAMGNVKFVTLTEGYKLMN